MYSLHSTYKYMYTCCKHKVNGAGHEIEIVGKIQISGNVHPHLSLESKEEGKMADSSFPGTRSSQPSFSPSSSRPPPPAGTCELLDFS